MDERVKVTDGSAEQVYNETIYYVFDAAGQRYWFDDLGNLYAVPKPEH